MKPAPIDLAAVLSAREPMAFAQRVRAQRVLLLAAFCLVLAVASPPLRAGSWSLYDLDSLVHLSEEIVEVEVIRWHDAEDPGKTDVRGSQARKGHFKHVQGGIRWYPPEVPWKMDVRIDRVHKGRFEQGQTVVLSDITHYRKPSILELTSLPLEPGDRLFVFLVHRGPSEIVPMPEDSDRYRPVKGGVALIDGTYLRRFVLGDTIGRPTAFPPTEPNKDKWLTSERFREQIQESLRSTREWAGLLEAEPEDLDVPRLLDLLSKRPPSTVGDLDYFAEQICIRLVETQDREILSHALLLTEYHVARRILARGFGTPEGRDYLLAKVSDLNEPEEVRLRCIDAMKVLGPIYRQKLMNIQANSYRPVGQPDEGNSAYLARIAKAAEANHEHEEICRNLIQCIGGFAHDILRSQREPMIADLRGAYYVLQGFYETQPSPELQYAIESAMTGDPESYKELNSPCGPYVSIVRPVDPSVSGGSIENDRWQRELRYEYNVISMKPREDFFHSRALILRDLESGEEHEIPGPPDTSEGLSGGGMSTIKLPADLTPGRYKVFFQFKYRDRVVSTGHHFVAEL